MLNVTKLLSETLQPDDPMRDGKADKSPKSSAQLKPLVVWNITRRCNLHCIHCYSDSSSEHYTGELTLQECIDVIDDLSDFKVPAVLLTGGEPMLHPHFYDLVGYASARGLQLTVSTNGTRIDSSSALKLKDLGVSYVEISLDGVGEFHDEFCGRTGAFRKVVEAFRHCRGAGLKVGLRLTLSRQTASQIPDILRFIEEEDIPRASFYHLAYNGRGAELGHLSAEETRACLRLISDAVLRWNREGSSREVLTVDQPADGAFFWLATKRRNPKRAKEIWRQLNWNGSGHHASGLGIANIDSQGDVHPDRFWLGHTLGNVKDRPFSKIWKSGQKDSLMAGLRDRIPRLTGRCGECRFREVCGGGFRVRALQVHGDPWAEDPGCYLRDYEIASDEHDVIARDKSDLALDS